MGNIFIMRGLLCSVFALLCFGSRGIQAQDFGGLLRNILGGGGNVDSQQGLLGAVNNIRKAIQNSPVLQERILRNKNPCDGAAPDNCRCTDGSSFQFSINYDNNPCTGGGIPDICFCPNGKSFKPENVVFDALERFGIPNCGRNQAPEFCTCQDGSTFDLVNVQIVQAGQAPTNIPQRCGGRIPSSCTCPDGRQITSNSVISRIIPAVQEILG